MPLPNQPSLNRPLIVNSYGLLQLTYKFKLWSGSSKTHSVWSVSASASHRISNLEVINQTSLRRKKPTHCCCQTVSVLSQPAEWARFWATATSKHVSRLQWMPERLESWISFWTSQTPAIQSILRSHWLDNSFHTIQVWKALLQRSQQWLMALVQMSPAKASSQQTKKSSPGSKQRADSLNSLKFCKVPRFILSPRTLSQDKKKRIMSEIYEGLRKGSHLRKALTKRTSPTTWRAL